jgi:hypothetical protein
VPSAAALAARITAGLAVAAAPETAMLTVGGLPASVIWTDCCPKPTWSDLPEVLTVHGDGAPGRPDSNGPNRPPSAPAPAWLSRLANSLAGLAASALSCACSKLCAPGQRVVRIAARAAGTGSGPWFSSAFSTNGNAACAAPCARLPRPGQAGRMVIVVTPVFRAAVT